MSNRAARLSEQASEQYAKGPENGPRSTAPTTLGYPDAPEPARVAFADEVASQLPVATTAQKAAPQGFDDGLGDFQPDSDAPPTEVRVGRPPARY